jgi:hypothetical protein
MMLSPRWKIVAISESASEIGHVCDAAWLASCLVEAWDDGRLVRAGFPNRKATRSEFECSAMSRSDGCRKAARRLIASSTVEVRRVLRVQGLGYIVL